MRLDPVEVSPVGVPTDVVVPTVPVMYERTKRVSYTSVATQVSVQAAALAPVCPVPKLPKARALVVHELPYRQSMADILYKARGLRLGTSESILGVR